MQNAFSLHDRQPIWMALSELYLDTELQERDYRYIAKTIEESPYSFSRAKEIDRKEVFPVLYPNL